MTDLSSRELDKADRLEKNNRSLETERLETSLEKRERERMFLKEKKNQLVPRVER
jgi:hypothetical protein